MRLVQPDRSDVGVRDKRLPLLERHNEANRAVSSPAAVRLSTTGMSPTRPSSGSRPYMSRTRRPGLTRANEQWLIARNSQVIP